MKEIESQQVLRSLMGRRVDFSGYDWKPFREGIEIARLYGDGEGGPSAAFLRYQPGATVPPHAHPGYEHILVLEGSQSDEKDVYRAGDMLISSPGSSHAVVSEEGCTVLAIWNEPVQFL